FVPLCSFDGFFFGHDPPPFATQGPRDSEKRQRVLSAAAGYSRGYSFSRVAGSTPGPRPFACTPLRNVGTLPRTFGNVPHRASRIHWRTRRRLPHRRGTSPPRRAIRGS